LQVLALNPLGDRSSELGPNSPYEFVKVAEADHEYPITKVLWEPLRSGKQCANLLATTGDHLRLWELTNEQTIPGTRNKGIKMKALCHSVCPLFMLLTLAKNRVLSAVDFISLE
jgi:hypothetical protein